MKSYLMIQEIQLKFVFTSVNRMGIYLPEPQRPGQSPDLPYELMRCDYVPLYSWRIRRSSPHLPGAMGYHNKTGTIIHTEDFPVWEWLLVEILANLAEQFWRAGHVVSIGLFQLRYLRLIWWLSEGVLNQLLTQEEQVEWDELWAPLWANGGFKRSVQYPDYTKWLDVEWDFERCFVGA